MADINNSFYEQEAHSWWQPGSSLSLLQALNPGRFRYLDQVVATRRMDYRRCRVLDIGCGGGFICEEFAKRNANVTGIDPSPSTIAEATRHAKKMGFEIEYQAGTGEQLPFEDNSFDLISCCDVLEHVQDLEKVMQETARVLKPGGLYFYDTINRNFLSWLIMIKLAQDWPLTRRVPKNTHVWNMFIKPQELKSTMTKAGLHIQHETGLGPSVNWQGIPTAVSTAISDKRLSAILDPLQIREIPTKQVLYMGWAINS